MSPFLFLTKVTIVIARKEPMEPLVPIHFMNLLMSFHIIARTAAPINISRSTDNTNTMIASKTISNVTPRGDNKCPLDSVLFSRCLVTRKKSPTV